MLSCGREQEVAKMGEIGVTYTTLPSRVQGFGGSSDVTVEATVSVGNDTITAQGTADKAAAAKLAARKALAAKVRHVAVVQLLSRAKKRAGRIISTVNTIEEAEPQILSPDSFGFNSRYELLSRDYGVGIVNQCIADLQSLTSGYQEALTLADQLEQDLPRAQSPFSAAK
jgi:hypothetical protein